MTYKYIRITSKPLPLDVIVDDGNKALLDMLEESRMAHAAPQLIAQLQAVTFALESVAHLQGMERELLPTTNAARELIATIIQPATTSD